MEHHPILLLSNLDGAAGNLSAFYICEEWLGMMKKLSNACTNVQQITWGFVRQHLFQPALPKRVSRLLCFQPGSIFLWLRIKAGHFIRSGPWTVKDKTASAALAEIADSIHRLY